jgi:hypothetical protein
MSLKNFLRFYLSLIVVTFVALSGLPVTTNAQTQEIDANIAALYTNPSIALSNFGRSKIAGSWVNNIFYPRMLGDMNNDGRTDIVGFGDNGVLISYQNTDGTFATPVIKINNFGKSLLGRGWASSLSHPRMLGDMNNDGRTDIVGFGDNGVLISYQNTDGTFATPVIKINNFGFKSLAGGWTQSEAFPRTVADMNNDGRTDIVGFGDNGVLISYQNTDGTFASPVLKSNHFKNDIAIRQRTVADMNNDGRTDILGFYGENQNSIYTNEIFVSYQNTDGTFSTPVVIDQSYSQQNWSYSLGYFEAIVFDMNNDGRTDIVGFGSDGIYVGYQNTDGTFEVPVKIISNFGTLAGGWSHFYGFPRFAVKLNTADVYPAILGFGHNGVLISKYISV